MYKFTKYVYYMALAWPDQPVSEYSYKWGELLSGYVDTSTLHFLLCAPYKNTRKQYIRQIILIL